MLQYALIAPRTQIPLAPPCRTKREARHYHCTRHHVGFQALATVQRHLDAGCALVYLCPVHGQELPYNASISTGEARRPVRAVTRGESVSCSG